MYLARAIDGSLYCGYARNPKERIAAHNGGRGSRILRGKLPVRLAYLRRLPTLSAALKYEIELKKKDHAFKAALCARWALRKRRRGRRG